MKKISIIVIVNVILLLIAFAVCEKIAHDKVVGSFNPLHPNKDLGYTLAQPYNYDDKKDEFGVYFPKDYKRPIALFGCSYAHGGGIPEDVIFARQLCDLSHRIVYKRARNNTSTDFMYRQIIDKNFKQEVPDVEYIVYVYLRYHGQRNLRYTSTLFSSPDIRYKITKKGELKEVRPFCTLPFYSSFIVKHFQDQIAAQKTREQEEMGEPLLIKFVEETYRKAQEYYPDVKFIFLEYPDGIYSLPEDLQCEKDLNRRNLPENVIKELEARGIIFVNAEELVGHELRDLDLYRHTDKEHPNGRAWKEVTEALVKRFNL